ncbi:unnamed protein product, partial [Protopolystoma xenopodis]
YYTLPDSGDHVLGAAPTLDSFKTASATVTGSPAYHQLADPSGVGLYPATGSACSNGPLSTTACLFFSPGNQPSLSELQTLNPLCSSMGSPPPGDFCPSSGLAYPLVNSTTHTSVAIASGLPGSPLILSRQTMRDPVAEQNPGLDGALGLELATGALYASANPDNEVALENSALAAGFLIPGCPTTAKLQRRWHSPIGQKVERSNGQIMVGYTN